MKTASIGLSLAAGAALALALAGCGQQASAPEAKPVEAAPPVAAAPAPIAAPPAVDRAAIQALMSPDETLEIVTLDASGAAGASGEVKGYKAPVYAVQMAQGQTLSVTFEPSNTNLYINVVDAADTSGAAVHRGEVDGPQASVTAPKAGVYLIKPYQPRAMARRDEAGTFKLSVVVK
jgi:hypothetical protein